MMRRVIPEREKGTEAVLLGTFKNIEMSNGDRNGVLWKWKGHPLYVS